ncbi:hypothetical protein PFY12_04180 [Chryseobacterium camelliae]|uniref:Lipoprotein n=1 Tax=Chryseobacterium camelliae TaxID=1265445 RepID=A0ABY7QNS2_9FLAO|nr:hypothetical protein [Chryseobacterium camelliae]WBV61324.1 hypothetical protein PFY12_04180 [Chryseobacterium camelliae]
MKKLWIVAVLGLVFSGGCADKKENREEFKEAHNKDSVRNSMGDSAVANSEPSQTTPADTTQVSKDSLTSPKK